MVTAPSPAAVPDATLVVIPVRFDSGRLPGKALASIGGEPMVWRVVQRARDAGVGEVMVATDDPRIADAVLSRGGIAVMTSSAPRNGSERVAEVLRSRPDVRVAIDLQGDEPLLDPEAIAALHRLMGSDPSIEMATVAFPLAEEDLDEPSVVKVEVTPDGRAAAFWRTAPEGITHPVHHHAGIYAYRRDALLRYADWPRTPGEIDLSLEQIRAMDHGLDIHVVRAAGSWRSVNTPEDLDRVRRLWDTGEAP